MKGNGTSNFCSNNSWTVQHKDKCHLYFQDYIYES